jgi:hypothetical protein
MKKLLIAAVLIALAGSVWAQEAMKIVTPDQLVWKDHPLFKGVQVVVLIGDPAKAGDLYVQRVKLPPNYQVAPHTHLGDETLTVLTGSVGVGMGEKFEKKGEMLKAGALWVHPAKPAHYVWTGAEETILQTQGVGPAGIEFVNPADDPRKK